MRIPVQDLIEILKVDVPEAPDVSLAGIRSDAATLEWSRPPSSRPVQKYVIQVNGVNGECASSSGLIPSVELQLLMKS